MYLSCPSDAFEMILCGASAVQVGTCHWNEGPKCFDRICQELKDLMQSKGYSSIDDFKGKLKEWSREGASLSRAARSNQKKGAGGASAGGPAAATKANVGIENQLTTAVLMILIAVLLADKFNVITI